LLPPWLFQPWLPDPWFFEPEDCTVVAVGWLLEAAEPVLPVSPELVQLFALALPDWAPETVTGLALAEPVEPPLPDFPDVGFEFTVAEPVSPVHHVLPELPDLAVELGCPCFWPPWLFQPWPPFWPPWLFQPWLPIWVSGTMPPWPPSENPNKVGAKLMLAPVLPDFPELPEPPEVAELLLLVASPVFPELALPDWAVVALDEEESALPLFPPLAVPLAVLAPELPDVALGEPRAVAEPELPGSMCCGPTSLAPAAKDPASSKTPPARPPTDAAFHLEDLDIVSFQRCVSR
jgi:hypothetical protein